MTKQQQTKQQGTNEGLKYLLVTLILVVAAIGTTIVFSEKPRDERDVAAAKEAKETEKKKQAKKAVLSDVVKALEVKPHAGELNVEFFTHEPAICRLGVGYSPSRQNFKTTKEKWYGKKHRLQLKELLPGQAYYRISGQFKDGRSFRESPAEVMIPAPVAGSQMAAAAAAAEDGKGTVSGAKKSEDAASSSAATAADTAGSPGQKGDEADKSSATAEQDPVDSRESEPSSDEMASLDDSSYEDPRIRPLPNADPSTPLGNRAIHASSIQRKLGPASVDAQKREQLYSTVAELQKEYEEYGDAQAARSLAETYLKLKDWRKALRYATKAVRISPSDVASHKIRLRLYKTFGMGWKIQETYEKLLQLEPDNQELAKSYARDKRIFGNFKTFGKPQKVEIK